jgi:hypothetical protein
LGPLERNTPEDYCDKNTALPDCVILEMSSCSSRRESASMPSGDSPLFRVIASGERPSIRPVRPSALLVGVASRFGRRSRLNEPRYKLLWQTLAIVASMLIFASLRPSTTAVIASDTTRSTMLVSSSQGLLRTVSGRRSQQMEVSKRAEVQLHQSDYFVAKDSTNHFNLHVQSIATVQKSDLTRTGQGSVSPKRVVVD